VENDTAIVKRISVVLSLPGDVTMPKNKIYMIVWGVMLITVGCATQPSPTSTPIISSPPPVHSPTAAEPVIVSGAISEIDAIFSRLADDGLYSGSVLIARQGEVLLNQGYGFADRKQKISNTPQTQYQIASLTKQFTAVSIMILQERGKVSISDPICDFIVDCPIQWREITIHHLLTHTSGIPNYDYRELDLDTILNVTAWSPKEFVKVIMEWPLDFQPGEKWSYSNSGYIILGYIIEMASGQPYETFLRQSILDPLNMKATGYLEKTDNLALGFFDRYTTDPVSDWDVTNLFSSGGLYSTAEDIFLWSQALYGEQLLSPASIHQMFTPHELTRDGEGYDAYGYACFLNEYHGRKIIYHGGSIDGFTSLLAHHPEEQVTIILLSNLDVSIVKVEYLGSTITDKLFGEE
jgi:CubicO group peptidase (beta-lactamase class C family)